LGGKGKMLGHVNTAIGVIFYQIELNKYKMSIVDFYLFSGERIQVP
jgi:hypothetical protein